MAKVTNNLGYSLIFIFLSGCLMLQAQAPCSSSPQINTLAITPNPYCPGSAVTLSLVNQYNFSGLLYTWSIGTSSASSSFSNFSTTSTGAITYSPTGSIWLRVAVTCTNGNQTTTMQPVALNVATNSMNVTNTVICSGQQASVSASSVGNLNWYTSPTSTTSVGSGSNFVSPPLAAGNYTYYVEATNACTFAPFRFPVTVTVNPSPTILVTNATLCANQPSYTITPGGALTYTFSSGNAVVSPSVSSIYTVSGTNAFGCVSTGTMILIKSPTQAPTITVNSGSICPNFQFTMQPAGAISYTFEGGSAVVSPTVSTNYTVMGTNNAGCIGIGTSSVTVWPSPQINVNNATICIGSTYTIVPSGAMSYTFAGGGPVVSPTVTSTYAVIGTDANGCVTNNAQMVTVTVHTLMPSVSVNSGSICLGNTFFLTPTGASSYTYSSISNWVSPLVTTVYTVTGKNVNSVCTASATATVIVHPGPALSVLNNPTLICVGENATITASGGLTYTINNVFFGNFLIVSPVTKTDYTISAGDAYGCVTTSVVSQYVNKCLSDKSPEQGLTYKIYPNPFDNYLVLETMEDVHIIIYDMQGHLLMHQSFGVGMNKIDLKDLQQGMYMLELKSVEGFNRVKLIKR